MQNLIINITQENFALLKNKEIGCFILANTLSEDFRTEFIAKAKAAEKLCLLLSDGKEFSLNNADGVVFDLSKEDAPQKILKNFKLKNPRLITGAISRNRRHEAMLISECEPEFVIFNVWNDGFDKCRELLEWYNEFFLIQSAVWPREKCDYTSLAADFVILDDVELL